MCVWRARFTGGDQQNLGDDYNLNENEAEPEREKQAALAGDDRNLSGKSSGVWEPTPFLSLISTDNNAGVGWQFREKNPCEQG